MTLYCHPEILDRIRPRPEGAPEYDDAGHTTDYCKNCGALKSEHTEEPPQ